MKYKGFFVKITPESNLHRENKNGETVTCEGFTKDLQLKFLLTNLKSLKLMCSRQRLILNC